MKSRAGVVAAVSLLAVLVLALAAPSSAFETPACGGAWLGSASCKFKTLGADSYRIAGVATGGGWSTVHVTVRLADDPSVIILECTGGGRFRAACEGSASVSVPGDTDLICGVEGVLEGAYACEGGI